MNFRVNHQWSEVWSVDCIDEYSFASNSVVNHGIALTDDNDNKKSSNEKATIIISFIAFTSSVNVNNDA